MRLLARIPDVFTAEPILMIRVYPNGDHCVAELSASGLRARGFRSDVPLNAAQNVIDSVRDEGARKRGRGRPPYGYWESLRVVRKLLSRLQTAVAKPFINPFAKPKP